MFIVSLYETQLWKMISVITEGTLEWPAKDEDMQPTPSPPKDIRPDTDIVDDFDRTFCEFLFNFVFC